MNTNASTAIYKSLENTVRAKQLLDDPTAELVSQSAAEGYRGVLQSVLQSYRVPELFNGVRAVRDLAKAAVPMVESRITRENSTVRSVPFTADTGSVVLLAGNEVTSIDELIRSATSASAEDTPEAYDEVLDDLFNKVRFSLNYIDYACEGRGVIPTGEGQTLTDSLEALHDEYRTALAISTIGANVWAGLDPNDQEGLARAVEVNAVAVRGDQALFGPQARTAAAALTAAQPTPSGPGLV